jgi:hypothetical protein
MGKFNKYSILKSQGIASVLPVKDPLHVMIDGQQPPEPSEPDIRTVQYVANEKYGSGTTIETEQYSSAGLLIEREELRKELAGCDELLEDLGVQQTPPDPLLRLK